MMGICTPPCFLCHFRKGGTLLWLPVFFSGWEISLQMGSSLKGKNLLLQEQILPFKLDPIEKGTEIKMLESILKVYTPIT